jgi:hypothetical protein
MDAAVPLDAENAPTGTWKTAKNAVSHSAHTHHRFVGEEDRKNRIYDVNTVSHTKFLTLPRTSNPNLEPEPRTRNLEP